MKGPRLRQQRTSLTVKNLFYQKQTQDLLLFRLANLCFINFLIFLLFFGQRTKSSFVLKLMSVLAFLLYKSKVACLILIFCFSTQRAQHAETQNYPSIIKKSPKFQAAAFQDAAIQVQPIHVETFKVQTFQVHPFQVHPFQVHLLR